MKKNLQPAIQPQSKHPASGFTLMETVIAIGVLAVLLTGFIAVFTPAAQGIRRSINSQQADRLTSTLERELVTVRSGQLPVSATGFDKGFQWIKEGNDASKAIFVYQYRGNPSAIRADGTATPLPGITGQPGKDYIIQSMARRISETTEFQADLAALDGPIFFVKPTQLVFSGNEMVLGSPGKIANPVPLPVRDPVYPAEPTNAGDYADAVIPFSAEFHSVPTKSFSYFNSDAFKNASTGLFYRVKNPVFTRNLAIRR